MSQPKREWDRKKKKSRKLSRAYFLEKRESLGAERARSRISFLKALRMSHQRSTN